MIFLMFFLASLINYNKQTCASLTMPKNVHTGNLSKNNILQLKYLDKKGRIFGGQLVKNIKDYPYMAKLSIEDYSCSAVILSKYYIITAGHCFMGRDCSAAKKNPWSKNGRLLRIGDESCNISYVSAKESEIELYAGGLTESNASSISDVEEIYVHPDFQYYNSEKKLFLMGTRFVPNVVVSRPSIQTVSSKSCSCCCPCLHLQFLQTVPGTLKITNALLGSLCNSLLINYGMSYSSVLGSAFTSMITTSSACLSTTSLLLFCYIISASSYQLIRSSIFELVFSIVATLSYLSSSIYMAFAVKMYLYPMYLVTLGFVAYPAMTAAYSLGFILTLLYGLDAFHSYKQFTGR